MTKLGQGVRSWCTALSTTTTSEQYEQTQPEQKQNQKQQKILSRIVAYTLP